MHGRIDGGDGGEACGGTCASMEDGLPRARAGVHGKSRINQHLDCVGISVRRGNVHCSVAVGRRGVWIAALAPLPRASEDGGEVVQCWCSGSNVGRRHALATKKWTCNQPKQIRDGHRLIVTCGRNKFTVGGEYSTQDIRGMVFEPQNDCSCLRVADGRRHIAAGGHQPVSIGRVCGRGNLVRRWVGRVAGELRVHARTLESSPP